MLQLQHGYAAHCTEILMCHFRLLLFGVHTQSINFKTSNSKQTWNTIVFKSLPFFTFISAIQNSSSWSFQRVKHLKFKSQFQRYMWVKRHWVYSQQILRFRLLSRFHLPFLSSTCPPPQQSCTDYGCSYCRNESSGNCNSKGSCTTDVDVTRRRNFHSFCNTETFNLQTTEDTEQTKFSFNNLTSTRIYCEIFS